MFDSDDMPAVLLIEAVLKRAREDAAQGSDEAEAFLEDLEALGTEAQERKRAKVEEEAPPPAHWALLQAELDALGWPEQALPRGTVPRLAAELGVARNTIYTHMRVLAGD